MEAGVLAAWKPAVCLPGVAGDPEHKREDYGK